MGDVFMERMVKRKMEGVDYLIVAGIVVGVLVVAMVGSVVWWCVGGEGWSAPRWVGGGGAPEV